MSKFISRREFLKGATAAAVSAGVFGLAGRDVRAFAADAVLKPGALAFILVKPQFEAPKHDVPPGGVVTDPAVRKNALEKVCNAAAALGWTLIEAADSPLRGPRGNLEMVAVFRTSGKPAPEKEGEPS